MSAEDYRQELYSTATTKVYLLALENGMKAVKFRKVADVASLTRQIRHVNMQIALGHPGICVEKAEPSSDLHIKITMRLLLNPLSKYLHEQVAFEEARVREVLTEVAETLSIAEEYNLHHGDLSINSVYWAEGRYVLGEFTWKSDEMTRNRDFMGLARVALYCGNYRNELGSSLTKEVLKTSGWSLSFKSIVSNLLETRFTSFHEVLTTLRDSPPSLALNLTHVQSSKKDEPLSSDTRSFQQARDLANFSGPQLNPNSSRGQSMVFVSPIPTSGRGNSASMPRMPQEIQTTKNQFNFSKGYPIPAELRDPDDINYSKQKISIKAKPASLEPSISRQSELSEVEFVPQYDSSLSRSAVMSESSVHHGNISQFPV